MDLRDRLHKAEKKAWLTAQQQIDEARKEWADAERRIRKKMRIYPDDFVFSDAPGKDDQELANADLRLPVGGRAAEELRDPEHDVPRKAIVSIYGRDVTYYDVDDDECGHLIQRISR